ncbi:hypothetical protein [Anaerobaca lacustris]|uniref:Uncharacterized protein n=1 Tax=Anaerobaca lacustris TaxID=3044600 RepID=A0AAW6U175_9BACT|nr:hypothetical protein [Sedimentisphaerales bacterium M17dextr]
MNDKELVRVAAAIENALWQLRKSRYARCTAQLSLFAGTIRNLIGDSRRLAAAVSRDWFAAAEHSCKAVSRQLGEIPFLASNIQSLLDRRHREMPTLSAIAADLWALQQEFDDVEFNGEESALCVVTEAITLEDVYLGRFRIALYLDSLSELYQKVPYYVMAIDPHPAATDNAITHPHVSHDVVCEGDGAAAIKAALEAGRLVDFFTMVRSILTTYNPDSPYVPLTDWHGVSCYECGYIMDGEYSYSCTSCDNAVCDDCSAVCASCSEIVCRTCAGTCEICERSLCPRCAKKKCSECESVCCESCLDDGLCPECREEREDNEEQETEDEQEAPTGQEAAVMGGRLVDGGQRAGTAYAAVQPDGVGQAAVLPGPIGQ